MHGRTPIYNFDEWSRQHYGSTFERRQNAKAKYERNEAHRIDQKFMSQNELTLMAICLSCIFLYYKFMIESSYDTPKERAAAEEHGKNGKST